MYSLRDFLMCKIAETVSSLCESHLFVLKCPLVESCFAWQFSLHVAACWQCHHAGWVACVVDVASQFWRHILHQVTQSLWHIGWLSLLDFYNLACWAAGTTAVFNSQVCNHVSVYHNFDGIPLQGVRDMQTYKSLKMGRRHLLLKQC